MNAQTFTLGRVVAAFAFATLLGCGVGVVGTGTGENAAPEDFGATSASVCTAPFAALVGCTTSAGAGPSTPGSASATFIDATTSRQVLATFDRNAIVFDAVCPGLLFRGSWGVDAGGNGRYYGEASRASGDRSLATLDIGATVNSTLLATLRDRNGSVLFGPRELKPGAASALDPSSCP